MTSRIKTFICLAIILVLMNGITCASSEANQPEIRTRTFAVPRINKVNVRREPFGSIRGKIDKNDSVYIIDTVEKRNIVWCRVIVFEDGWYQAYIQADYLIPLHDVADDAVKIVGGDNHALLLRADGTCLALGSAWRYAMNISGWKNVRDIAAPRFSSVALLEDGSVRISDPDGAGVSEEVLDWKNVSSIHSMSMVIVEGLTGIDRQGRPLTDRSWESYMEVPVPDWTDLRQFMHNGWIGAGITESGVFHLVVSAKGQETEPEACADVLHAEGTGNVRQFALGEACLTLLMNDGTVRFYGKNEYGAKECESWTDITQIAARKHYVLGLRADGSVVMAGKMVSPDCHPFVPAEGIHADTYVNFQEEGLLNSWDDMIYIDATDTFILGIHADGSPDMIGAYRYNP